MKKFIILFSLVVLITTTSAQAPCCNKSILSANSAQQTALAQNTEAIAIEAYYFHFTRRCVTCQSVEKVTADALKELYGDKIVLKSINLDEKGNEALAKKLAIQGQTLLVVNGTKRVELTNDGFMYARTNPEKLKEKIKSAIESLK
jgi:hypothetical protein